jgi:tRNA uridine 5-carboxymethylaminomethyl modification enzyme
LGLVAPELANKIEAKKASIAEALDWLTTNHATPTKEFLTQLEAIAHDKINDKTAWIDILGRGDWTQEQLVAMLPDFARYDAATLEQVLIEAKYHRYIEKQQTQIGRMHDMLRVKIPAGFDYATVQGLSNEIVEKLQRATPPTLQSASRISGITPAALEIIHIYIKLAQRKTPNR